ncbi:MAG TPA: peroxiredoxin [Thermoanaerobaculia bacterium]|nr:peroxiredoxin [Thermoanaerobaculia bacterium]
MKYNSAADDTRFAWATILEVDEMQDYYEPKVGDLAPEFRLPSTGGGRVTLRDFDKKWIVLYFYPKDDTPGCTAEACAFRDLLSEIEKEGAVILGVSTGTVESHEKFRSKYNLNFPLLADQMADVAKMYGGWKQKNLYGRQVWGVARVTYLIGPDRRVKKVYKKVDPKSHCEQILTDLRALKE